MSDTSALVGNWERGLSLIEMMVALLIGSLLILGLVQVFSASRTAYQMADGMARVQENARFAMDFLQRDLRMAGHFGCVNDQAHLQTADAMQVHFDGVPTGPLTHPLNFGVSIAAYNAPGTSPANTVQIGAEPPLTGVPAVIAALNPVAGSDILVLRYLTPAGAAVTNVVATGGNESVTLKNGRWSLLTAGGRPNPVLFGIADCRFVDVFRGAPTVTGGNNAVIDVVQPTSLPATNLAGRYTPHPAGQTQLYRAESIAYYVGQNPANRRALFRAHFDGASYVPEEMVEGVESLQLIFGLDRETDLANRPPTGYIDDVAVAAAAWTPVNWRRAGAVQVGLLMGSPEPAATEGANRRVLGVTFQPPSPADGLYRTAYENTIALRNRLYGN